MGKQRKSKKRKNSSGGSNTQSKNARNGGSPVSASVSDSIHKAKSVLYGDDPDSELNDAVFETSVSGSMSGSEIKSGDKSVEGPSKDIGEGTSPSNSDILTYLRQMDKKLNKLDTLEEKVSNFDSELKKLWLFVQTEFKEDKDAMRIDTLEFSLGLAQDNITQLTKEKAKVNDLLLYVQSQSMRNNLIFTSITGGINEKPEVAESKLRTFMVDKLKLVRDIVHGFQLERVHKMGDNSGRF